MNSKELTALNYLKKALLSINGAMSRLGKDKNEMLIIIPKNDLNYFVNILSSGVSSLSNFYVKIDEDTFTLCGLSVTKSFKEE